MNADDQIPLGIVFLSREISDTEFAQFKARFNAAYGEVGEGQPLPVPVHIVHGTSRFLRSACCDATIYQTEDFAADCLPVVCSRCGAVAGSPSRRDVEFSDALVAAHDAGEAGP